MHVADELIHLVLLAESDRGDRGIKSRVEREGFGMRQWSCGGLLLNQIE